MFRRKPDEQSFLLPLFNIIFWYFAYYGIHTENLKFLRPRCFPLSHFENFSSSKYHSDFDTYLPYITKFAYNTTNAVQAAFSSNSIMVQLNLSLSCFSFLFSSKNYNKPHSIYLVIVWKTTGRVLLDLFLFFFFYKSMLYINRLKDP